MRDRAPRAFSDDIESVLQHYGRHARVVELSRRDESLQTWVYLGRLWLENFYPASSFLEMVKAEFGGGYYRAKIYGQWNKEARREQYLEQVTFAIAGSPVWLE